jgi:hypothetical protein
MTCRRQWNILRPYARTVACQPIPFRFQPRRVAAGDRERVCQEFIAEGQLFYYHKRLNELIINKTAYDTYNVTPTVYTCRVPMTRILTADAQINQLSKRDNHEEKHISFYERRARVGCYVVSASCYEPPFRMLVDKIDSWGCQGFCLVHRYSHQLHQYVGAQCS